MSNGYDLMEMIHRHFYLFGADPLQVSAFKLAGALFLAALFLGWSRR